jgi:hypothetical protein
MRQRGWSSMFLFVVSLIFAVSPALADVDDGSKITITSPKDGATVGDTFPFRTN